MAKLLITIILFSLFNSLVFATTFAPLSIKKQIIQSDGIVVGEVINVSSYNNEKGQIVSSAFIKVDKWMGSPVKNNHIEVNFPGGKVGGKAYKVFGAPKFVNGEKVVIFTRNVENQSFVNNLGLGKFSIKNLGKTQIMVNQIFPNLPEVGQMNFNSFVKLTESLKQKRFNERFKNKYERNIEKQTMINSKSSPSRKIASINKKTKKDKNELADYWLVILLGLISVGYSLIRRKSE